MLLADATGGTGRGPVAADVTEGRFRFASPATADVLAILGVTLFLAVLPIAAATHTLTGPSVGASIPGRPRLRWSRPRGGQAPAAQSGGVDPAGLCGPARGEQLRGRLRGAHLPFRARRAAARPGRGAAGLAVGTSDRARPAGNASVPRRHSPLALLALGAAGLPGDRRLLAGEHLHRRHRHHYRAPYPGGYRRQPDHHRPASRECRLADTRAAADPARPGGVLAVVHRPPGG